MNEFTGKRVFILGDGISGKGAKAALMESGAAICEKLAPNLDYIIVSPGVSNEHEIFGFANRNNISVIGELELGYRLCRSPIIAVTGTNGKTTVTSLIGEILRQGGYKPLVCGNIGVSFAQAAIKEDYNIVALEVSSFQLETVSSFRPDVAVITNVTPDHLDRHKTFKSYLEIKKRISACQTQNDYLILPEDLIYPAVSRVVTFGDNGDCRVEGDNIIFMDKAPLKLNEISLCGRHNLMNVMAATAACMLVGVESEAIKKAISAFRPPLHRIEYIGKKNGVSFFDDSKGTNIGAVLAATESMQGETCLILCGNDKGYEFDELFLRLDKRVKSIIAFGEIKKKIAAAALRCGYWGTFHLADNMADAVHRAYFSGMKNVLLSPGSASFDMYSSYIERGKDFAGEVEKL